MEPYRRRALRDRVSAALRWRLERLPGWRLLLDPTSPVHVYRRWRTMLRGLLSADRFTQNGLDNVWARYPGKLDRQLIVIQGLRNVCARKVEGVVVEFGCYQGHTAVQIVGAMQEMGDLSPVLLFDSFQGVPPSDHPGDSHWTAGMLMASSDEVRRRFESFGNVRIVEGFFKDTLPEFPDLRVKLAHVDADLYVSIRDVNDWMLDRVVPGGIIIYDDYGFPSCVGAMQAVDQAMAKRQDYVTLYLPTGQYVAIKHTK